MSSFVSFEFKHVGITRVTLTEEEFLHILKKKEGDALKEHTTTEKLSYQALFNRLKRRKSVKMTNTLGDNYDWDFQTIEDDCVLDSIRDFVEEKMKPKIESKK